MPQSKFPDFRPSGRRYWSCWVSRRPRKGRSWNLLSLPAESSSSALTQPKLNVSSTAASGIPAQNYISPKSSSRTQTSRQEIVHSSTHVSTWTHANTFTTGYVLEQLINMRFFSKNVKKPFVLKVGSESSFEKQCCGLLHICSKCTKSDMFWRPSYRLDILDHF